MARKKDTKDPNLEAEIQRAEKFLNEELLRLEAELEESLKSQNVSCPECYRGYICNRHMIVNV